MTLNEGFMRANLADMAMLCNKPNKNHFFLTDTRQSRIILS